MVQAVERCVPELDGWHVVDLCCGKSLNTALLALRHPGLLVTAVDRCRPSLLPHYAEAGIDRVEYWQQDVLAANFVEELVHRLVLVARPTVILGMHLCGLLSERAISAFQGSENARVCVLSPCCLPNLADAPRHLLPVYGTGHRLRRQGLRNEGNEKVHRMQYEAWCQHLSAMLREVPGTTVTEEEAENMMSIKNIVLAATKL